MKKILVPVAFTPQSDAIVRYAGELARCFRAEIILLHVVGEHDMLQATRNTQANTSLEDLETAAFQQLATLDPLIQSPLYPPLHVEHRVVVGFPGEVITQTASDTGADLIVMPHLHDQEGSHPLAPVVAETLHHASCAVLLIPTDLTFRVPKRIFFAFDFDSQLPEELAVMREWLKGFGAQMHGIHILDSAEERPVAAHQLETIAQIETINAAFSLEEGPWREQIETMSTIEGIDLLAIAPPHRSGLQAWLDFRALHRLVDRQPLPVLVFRSSI